MNKLTIYIIIALIIVSLSGTIVVLFNKLHKLDLKYKTEVSNNKSLMEELSGERDNGRLLNLTIEQLRLFQDSISLKLDSIVRENKIKDKELARLLYIETTTKKSDTLRFRDTVFIKDLCLDTLIGDKWFKMNLNLKYPNIISYNVLVRNEYYGIFLYRKETINPPKKCIVARWFQRKQTIVIFDLYNSNPYTETNKKRFIDILKK